MEASHLLFQCFCTDSLTHQKILEQINPNTSLCLFYASIELLPGGISICRTNGSKEASP